MILTGILVSLLLIVAIQLAKKNIDPKLGQGLLCISLNNHYLWMELSLGKHLLEDLVTQDLTAVLINVGGFVIYLSLHWALNQGTIEGKEEAHGLERIEVH